MELGQVIASRTFSMDDAVVELLIGVPIPEGPDYFCPVQVKGLGNEKIRKIGGIDSLQALILGIEYAAIYLSTTTEAKSGQLTFLGASGIGFGASP
ncbi:MULTISPECIES: hypothetical protein [Luteibacter]|uniref:DUF6968 family protein n=1 Tax=Luteibacter sp. dw_328 TaxID=2719796 RepID=UPI0007BF8AF9|nr:MULTISPECIES: hypothetical protein [Luteibacter]